MSTTALAFMAHPDDAEILCGGTLLRLRPLGWEVHIATCTAGDCSTVDQTPWDTASIRTGEARKAAELIGAGYHCLGELDGLVVYDKPTLNRAYDLFRRLAPSLVFIHHPQDYMMDHVQAGAVGRAASFIYAMANISPLPVRPGSCVPHLDYCDTLEGLDPWGQPIPPTALVDVSGVMPRKAEILACHASERE